MRNLEARPSLATETKERLDALQREINGEPDDARRKAIAEKTYNNARSARWFLPVINALKSLCGEVALCMYCSCNEPSHIEHYRPKSVFPEQAMQYENFLWICDICNRAKSNRFPPTTETGEPVLNPIDDSVWEHFFLDDRFGRLTKRIDPATELPLPRAQSTCDVVNIDRETVQIKRQKRFSRLRQDVGRALSDFNSGRMTVEQLQEEINELRNAPFQADVADYFLNGPGSAQEPFRSALIAAGEQSDAM